MTWTVWYKSDELAMRSVIWTFDQAIHSLANCADYINIAPFSVAANVIRFPRLAALQNKC